MRAYRRVLGFALLAPGALALTAASAPSSFATPLTSPTTVATPGTTITTSPTTRVVPLTASGCNYNVCVRVIGSGLTVSEIEVWTYNNACLPIGTEVAYNYGPTDRACIPMAVCDIHARRLYNREDLAGGSQSRCSSRWVAQQILDLRHDL